MTKNNILKDIKFTDPQLQKFFDALGEDSNKKIQLFYYFALTTGLRVNEILNLSYGNIEDKSSLLSLKPSKKDEVELILSDQLLEVIKNEHKENPSDLYIFQSKKSNNVLNQPPKPISRQSVNYAFKKANDDTGIPITPNKLRHMYATEFFKKISMQGSHVLNEKTLKKFR